MSDSVVENLKHDPNEGTINYKDIRYCLMRPETIGELYRQIEERHGDSCRGVFFQAGYRGVSLSMQAYAKAGMLPPGEELLAFMAKMAGQVGWGKVENISLDNHHRKIVFEVRNSVFAQDHTGREHPVCDSIRGAFTAIAEAVWLTPASAEEVACTAMGHDRCRFVITAGEKR